jgi:hypothetical protein
MLAVDFDHHPFPHLLALRQESPCDFTRRHLFVDACKNLLAKLGIVHRKRPANLSITHDSCRVGSSLLSFP